MHQKIKTKIINTMTLSKTATTIWASKKRHFYHNPQKKNNYIFSSFLLFVAIRCKFYSMLCVSNLCAYPAGLILTVTSLRTSQVAS